MSNAKGTALITGASSGIGWELAKVFAMKGHDLILSARSEDKLLQLKKELEAKYSIKAEVIRADLSKASGALELFTNVQNKNLSVDILVNNAGLGVFGSFATENDWAKEQECIQVNILALTELCKRFLPMMVKRKSGKILNVASTAAFQPGPTMAIYYATKAYVLHFSEAIAEELSGTGVTVTALCPGATESGFKDAAALENSKLFKDKKLPTSLEVATYAYDALMRKQRVAIHGVANYLLAQSVRLMPRNIVTKVAKKIQERDQS